MAFSSNNKIVTHYQYPHFLAFVTASQDTLHTGTQSPLSADKQAQLLDLDFLKLLSLKWLAPCETSDLNSAVIG